MAESSGEDATPMRLQDLHGFARRGVPDGGGPIRASSGDEPAVRVVPDREYSCRVSAPERHELLAGARIADARGLAIEVSGDERRPVGRESDDVADTGSPADAEAPREHARGGE